MIKATNLVKRFDELTALDSLNTVIEDGCICGLVGSNGAGKSTLLRLIAGVYQPTEGRITVDEQDIYENMAVKQQIYFVPDDLYFLPGSTMDDMAKYLKNMFSLAVHYLCLLTLFIVSLVRSYFPLVM